MKRKNLSLALVEILLFPVLFLLYTPGLYAQEEVIATDTSVVDEIDYEETDTAEINYFLKNHESNGDKAIQLRKLPDSAVKALLNDDAFWYANGDWNKPKQKKQELAGSPPGLVNQAWFRALLWIIIIGSFIAVITWYLVSANAGIFRRRPVIIAKKEDEIFSENIFEIGYTKEINKAVGSGNFRLAVRLMFLQLLKTLSEKSLIQYKQDRTNLDYLIQLRQSAYYRDFYRLTRNYEYAWYGHFEINNEMFSSIQNEFETFNRKLN